MGFWSWFWDKLLGRKNSEPSFLEHQTTSQVQPESKDTQVLADLGLSMQQFVDITVKLLPIENNTQLKEALLSQNGLDEFSWKKICEKFMAYLSDTKNAIETQKRVELFSRLYAQASQKLFEKISTHSIDPLKI